MGLRICLILTITMAAAQCVGQTKTEPNQLRQTALSMEQQGNNSKAEVAWRAFLNAAPSNPEPYAHLGLLEARQEHYKEAVPLYRKALALGPQIPGVRLNLGLALFKSGEMKESIEIFEPLLNSESVSSPMAQQLTILIGMAHYGLAEYAQAVPYLKEAAARDTPNLPIRLALAHSCLWSKQYQCVLDTYHEILALNAESAEADMLAGEAQDELKNPRGAIEQFRAAVKANPKEPDVHFGLGYLLWTQRQYSEAAQEFQAELADNPNHVEALVHLADIQVQLNHPEAAFPLFEKALRLDPALELAHLDLGILYADDGRREDALRELKIAAKLAPTDINVHWRLGRLFRSMGKTEDAKAEFDKASTLTKAADEALINKIHNPHANPAPSAVPSGK